jgi:hypothetical protein
MGAHLNQVLSRRQRQTTSYCNLIAPHFRYLLETSLGSVADGPDYLGSGLRSHLPQDCDCE